MRQRSINLSTCHSDLCLLHCSVVEESFAPNTSWKEAGRKPLYWCVIQMVFSTIHSNFQERSEQWYLYLWRKSIVDIINTGFHNQDTLRHKYGFLSDPRTPDTNQFTQKLWSHGNCPPMCGFEKCVMYDALGGFRKSKSCQKHLQLFTGLQNYVLMTVRTEKTMKN